MWYHSAHRIVAAPSRRPVHADNTLLERPHFLFLPRAQTTGQSSNMASTQRLRILLLFTARPSLPVCLSKLPCVDFAVIENSHRSAAGPDHTAFVFVASATRTSRDFLKCNRERTS